MFRILGLSTDRLRWLQFISVAFVITVIVATWTATLQRFRHEAILTTETSLTNQRNLATIISVHLDHILEQSVIYTTLAAGWFSSDSAAVEKRMLDRLAVDQAFTRSELFDVSGKSLFASSHSVSSGSVPTSLKSAEAFQPTVGQLPTALGASWQLPLFFPVENATGEVSGILELVLDLGYFLRLYQDVELGNGHIHILVNDGREIARMRRGGMEVGGKPIFNREVFSDTHVTSVGTLFRGGSEYLIATHHSGTYPFTVMVNQVKDDVLRDHMTRKRRSISATTILTLIFLGGTFWMTSMFRDQRRAYDALAKSEDEKRLLIESLEAEKRHAMDLAAKDHLTGLPNRRTFLGLGERLLKVAKRNREGCALFFVDLNRFKAINDTLGHHVGDLLLQTMAARLRSLFRETDLVARLGGDEFVLLLPVASEGAIPPLAEKLVEVISEPCTNLAGNDLQVYPSIGIAVFPRDGQDVDTLLRHADLAMYQSKNSQKRSFTFFDASLNVDKPLQFDMEQRFSKGLMQGEFILHFQPKVSSTDYRVTGLEALVRWRYPGHGLIYPGDFIPLAENTGHIVELGEWVIGAVCKQIWEWQQAGLSTVPVAINVSASQLRDTVLLDHISACLSNWCLTPEDIAIEVTESCLMENLDTASHMLNVLSKSGIQIALDDFGKGFSSLGHIRTLPIDTIKIDRSFISDINNSHDDAVIVASTIALAHNLGMRVVAEGVETKDQVIHLKTARCDELQGYYLSRPVPAELAAEILKRGFFKP